MGVQQTCHHIVHAKWFSPFIIATIIFNAIVIGLETSQSLMASYGDLLHLINSVVLGIFIIEALLKMGALLPNFWNYFKNGWNIFDFSVIVLSLLPATGQFAMLARLARLLRVMRLLGQLKELRLIVSTLFHSLPGIANIMVLMSLIFYIYGVLGYQLFHTHDPTHWGSLGLALLTLFRIVTLEDWTDVMYTAMEAMPYAWVYFVSFVILGTFIIINMFIAVVMNSLQEAQQERDKQSRVSRQEILSELKKQREVIERLEKQIR